MTYEEEQKQLFRSVMRRYDKPADAVEFIISSHCNQKCEYCYFYKHGEELYPPEINKKENILRNLPLLLEWLDEEEYAYNKYDVFSGEFFNLPYWEDVLQIFYDYTVNGGKKRLMTIPTNLSFCMSDEKIKKVEYWIDKIKSCGIDLFLSCSVDGPMELENVERGLYSATTKDENNFYDKAFSFVARHAAGFHPMVTREFVKNYKQNYDWWMEQLKKYDMTLMKEHTGKIVYDIPMFLEVRDAEQWDDESLENYRQFLWYIAEKDYNDLHQGNLESFAYHMLDDFTPDIEDFGEYNNLQPYLIQFPSVFSHMGCTVSRGAMFRVGDLALVPCHRTMYPNFIHGHLIVNEEGTKIVDVKPENVLLEVKIKNFNPCRSMLKCGNCDLKLFCMRGCLGSQYERNKELFSPEEQVCKLMKIKYKTIHEIAEHYGIYDLAESLFGISQKRRDIVKYERKVFGRL